jgi:PTH1 family peptidyl-tRNA hydrolase
MKVVVGLGNPGSRYAGTRHNVGFMVVDVLAQSGGSSRWQTRFQAEVAEIMEGSEKVLLAKPQTFMNLSGLCVRQLLDFYQMEPSALLVVCDDVNLPLGQLRARARGTHGGHKGLRDVQRHLGSTEYARLRLGVGAAPGRDLADYVLDRFQAGERDQVQDMIIRAAQAVGTWVASGIDACMNQFNRREEKEGSD